MKRTIEQSRNFFKYTKRQDRDAYFTREKDAKDCVEFALRYENKNNKFIEPFAGKGAFSKYLPNCVSYDIEPRNENIIKEDSLFVSWSDRIAITNMPFNLKNQVIEKALLENNHFWTICSYGMLNRKDCFVDKVLLFEFGGWTVPRTYLTYDLDDGRVKMIYSLFCRVCRNDKRYEPKLSDEIWQVSATKQLQIDDRFYIRDINGKIRKARINDDK